MHIYERSESGEPSCQYTLFDGQVVQTNLKPQSSGGALFARVRSIILECVLPAGFPASVTPDYIHYQIYDSLQAFASSIAGLLSSRAVLEGFGVGEEGASSTNAVLLSAVQDVTGRFATIFFAWKFGTSLEPEAKMYRLAADFFNDGAFVLDCLLPALPAQLRVAALCLSGTLRAICGVCGGGAKAALSIHFAKTGNIGELNAKDSSQETLIGLLGMLVGSFIMSHITSRRSTLITLISLLSLHLMANYFAVRSVIMTSLNRRRTNIVYGTYRKDGTVLSPLQASRMERIFQRPDALLDSPTNMFLGVCTVCKSFKDFLHSTDPVRRNRNELESSSSVSIANLLNLYDSEKFLLCPGSADQCARTRYIVYICFKDNAGPEDRLKAWVHAYEFSLLNSKVASKSDGPVKLIELLQESLSRVLFYFPDLLTKLASAGWDTSIDAIVTTSVMPVIFTRDEATSEKKY